MFKRMKKYLYKRMWLMCLIPISVCIMLVAGKSSSLTEHVFSDGICKYVMQAVSTVTGLVPFSIAEICVLCLPVVLILAVVLFIRNLIKNPVRRKRIVYKAVIDIVCIASVLIFMYVMFDGINYYRYDFSYYAGFEPGKSTVKELYKVGEDLIARGNAVREKLDTEDSDGVFILGESMGQVSEEVLKAFDNLSEKYPVLSGHYGKNKSFLTSKYISYTGMAGVFVPFTLEANNNVDVVQYNIPSDMCHEQAHLRGFIKEDEANYIAYLACMASDNPEFLYSGIVQAYICVENAIYDENQELAYKLSENISEKMSADIQANNEYWNRIENTKVGKEVSDTTQAINDTYLKANGEEEGVKSYGLMVDLLVSDYRHEGFFDK